jgi:hypothetical protein
MDSYDRKDLLLCIEGLGRQVKLESDDGEETILVYQKGPDSLGTLKLLGPHAIYSLYNTLPCISLTF